MPQSVSDVLSGAFGAPVNRPQLNAFVANSQAINGLRSAQTDEAMTNAQNAINEQGAQKQVEGALVARGASPPDAHLAALTLASHYGNFQQVWAGMQDMQKSQALGVLGDSSQLGTPAQTAASQVTTGKLAEPTNAGAQLAVPAGLPTPNVVTTPEGASENALRAAQANQANAGANLHNTQAAAGGWNPHAAGSGLGLTPEQSALISNAVQQGRLNPDRINSRTAGIYAGLEAQNGGTINYNSEAALGAAQRNVLQQNKNVGYLSMPTILSHMTTLGKALNGGTGYSDNATVGKIQQWMNGQFNDPAYTEYMAVRNDALMKLANLMRGAGMSDQAHSAEIEAASPTLSPLALDAYLRGQMVSVKPYYDKAVAVTQHGAAATAANVAAQGGAPAAPGAPAAAPLADPLGIR